MASRAPTVTERWERGIPHDPRSLDIANCIAEIDFEQCGDQFGWKFGGDGDSGETLLYQLDVYFERKDAAVSNPECASCGEEMPRNECPKSKRPCRHHCNHSWTHDACDWCGDSWGDGGEVIERKALTK